MVYPHLPMCLSLMDSYKKYKEPDDIFFDEGKTIKEVAKQGATYQSQKAGPQPCSLFHLFYGGPDLNCRLQPWCCMKSLVGKRKITVTVRDKTFPGEA